MKQDASLQFKVENPGEVMVTATITMSLQDWLKLGSQLKTDYPSWELGVMIEKATQHVREHFYGGSEEDE